MSAQDHFVHLRVHSAYSLAEGAVRIKDMVKQCRRLGMPAVAVTDTNNLFGAMELALAAKENGIQPLFGLQGKVEQTDAEIVLLVQSEQGYLNLSGLISDSYMASADAGEPKILLESLAARCEGLIALSGGPVSGHLKKEDLSALHKIFGDRFYIELQRHGIPEEAEGEDVLLNWAYENDVPLVATNNVFYPSPDLYEAHDAFMCIAQGAYINDPDRRRVTRAHYFKTAEEMTELFRDIPEAVHNTLVVAQRCHYLLEVRDPILPPYDCGQGRDELEELKSQAREGLLWRLENFVFINHVPEQDKGKVPKVTAHDRESIEAPYWERLEFEIKTISQMGFPGYFLIVSDFIKWAKARDIPVGPGRGSGAGSLVAWVLQITDVDPLRFGLLFERFLNPERVSMPDFDVDFCQERREEVIRYVQEKYGQDKVAQIITFGKLQARAVVRDVGRVLQMPYGAVDRIAKMIPFNPASPVTLQEAIDQDTDLQAQREQDSVTRQLLDIALKLEGLYRHASTHAAGLVIGDRPLHELVPLYRDPRSDMPVTQYNMKYVEMAGLVKFDFLGLKTMTVIQKAVDMIALRGKSIDVLQVSLDDAKSYELISRGHTVGVFQLESGGMQDMLRKARPDRFEDIVALVSLYRPGPMDNIPAYTAIKHGEQEPDYMHPLLEPVLKETYGIMIYQEQVMQAAQVIAGYSLGGADLLRRAMGKKIKEAMDAERAKFVLGAAEKNNVPADQANQIFDKIAKFAGYGFNKSHAAAYALIAYWTAWLKAHYPVEFMAASMCLDIQNTEKLAVFKQECDRLGVGVLPPDINASGVFFTVEDGAVRYALSALKNVGAQAMEAVVNEREARGKFKSLEDFFDRINVKTMNKRQLEMLAASGAFDTLYEKRAAIFDSAEFLLRHAQQRLEEKETGQENLFGGSDKSTGAGLPDIDNGQHWNPLEKLRHEFDAIGFYLSAHPLQGRKKLLERIGYKDRLIIEDELEVRSAMTVNTAAVLIKKQEKFSQKMGRKFAILQLSDISGVYEVMLFSDTLSRVRGLLVEGESFAILLNAEKKGDQIRYTVQDVKPLEEALSGKELKLTICLNEDASFKEIGEILTGAGEAQAGGTFVKIESIIARLGTEPLRERVVVELPGCWNLGPEHRNRLLSAEGVSRLVES